MADDLPERSPTANFAAALSVTHNAKIGIATGVGFTLVVFVFFVVIRGASRPTPYYVVLGVTLAFAVALLITVALTLVSAYQLIHEESATHD